MAAGDPAESGKFQKGVEFILDFFPPQERVPAEAFMKAASEDAARSLGGNPRNRYCFNIVMQGGKAVGATSAMYLDGPATLLIGFVRAGPELRGEGVKKLLGDAVAFGQAAAAENGKTLRSVSGEMERPEAAPDQRQAMARIRLFRSMGMGILGYGTTFNYGQPTEAGGFVPLALVVRPLDGSTAMQPKKRLGS